MSRLAWSALIGVLIAGETCPVASHNLDPISTYDARRQQLIDAEENIAAGASLEKNFTAAEVVADRIIRSAKALALAPEQPDGGQPIASQHFLDAKPRIDKAELFPMLQSMPKGAVLHTHPDALQDVAWTVQQTTYDDRLWVCGDVGTGQLDNTIQFQYSDSPTGPTGYWDPLVPFNEDSCTWKQVTALRNASGDHDKFDRELVEDLSMMTANRPPYKSQSEAWTKFQNCFGRISGIYFFAENYAAIMTAAFKAMRDDGVQHLEFRQMLAPGGIYFLNGTVLPVDATLEAVQRVADAVGITVRVQVAEMRASDPATVAKGLQEANRLMAKYPDLVVGFDLVGQEDAGRPLIDFLPELLNVSDAELGQHTPPFYFHAGETDEVGLGPDLNLYDAILLNSTRIGHGYSLARHPMLRQMAQKQVRFLHISP